MMKHVLIEFYFKWNSFIQ